MQRLRQNKPSGSGKPSEYNAIAIRTMSCLSIHSGTSMHHFLTFDFPDLTVENDDLLLVEIVGYRTNGQMLSIKIRLTLQRYRLFILSPNFNWWFYYVTYKFQINETYILLFLLHFSLYSFFFIIHPITSFRKSAYLSRFYTYRLCISWQACHPDGRNNCSTTHG